jgi:hypothetical protein
MTPAQLAGPRQDPGERPERLLVLRAQQHVRLAPRARRLGGEAQAAHAGEPVEALRRKLPRLAVHPQGALRVHGRVVDAVDEVPRDRLARRQHADARRPQPRRAPGVVAGRFVHEPAQLDSAVADPSTHVDTPALARPDVLRPMRGDDLDRRAVADLELHHARHERARGRHHEPARAPQRALAEVLRRAVPDRPPCGRRRSDARDGRAHHQLGPEGADPRPALERAPAEPCRHAIRGQRERRPPGAWSSPRAPRLRHARTICSRRG